MTSLIPTDFPHLTVEDIVLFSRGHNFSGAEFVQLVGHLSSEVLVNRFITLCNECYDNNINDTDCSQYNKLME